MNTEAALLGLIKMHPSVSGHQLKMIAEKSSASVVPINTNRIYLCLKEMTEKGLVSLEPSPQSDKSGQKLYSLTKQGQRALDDWMNKPFDFRHSRASFDEYLLQLAGMAYLDNSTILRFIDDGIAYLEEEIIFRLGESIAIDDAYIENAEEDLRRKYKKLWDKQRQLMLDEATSRKAWLEELRLEYE